MKTVFKLYYFLSIAFMMVFFSCSDYDEPDSGDLSAALTEYKWVCRESDEPLVDDDLEWVILDDYVTTLYFVSDYECVVRYYRKHYDSDDGTSYTRESQTVKYSVQGNVIVLENSEYTESQFVFRGDCLETSHSVYSRESIEASDREWLNENYQHISSSEEKEDYAANLNTIKKHVTVTSSYGGYMWKFHIESTLHEVFDEDDFVFGLGHGDVNGSENVSLSTYNQIPYTEYRTHMENGLRIVDVVSPFWAYYAFGVPETDQSLDAWVECEIYYATYLALLAKPSLSDAEQELLRNLPGYFREYEIDADRYYNPSVYVEYKDKLYKVAAFRRAL